MPAQTYPIYQKNEYSNPPASQPSDITSYLQGLMVQNQPQALDLSLSNIRQILLNRILSGQSMQSSFDQNSKAYGSNLVEFPNNAMAPNAVNSYFAAPTVINPPVGVNNEDKTADIKTEERRKKTKKRKSESRRRQYEPEDNHKNSNKIKDIQESDRKTNKKSKRRPRKPKTEATAHDTRSKNSENEDDNKTKKRKRKNKDNEVTNSVDEDIKEDLKPRRRRKKKPKQDRNNTEKVISEQTTSKPKQIQEGINVAHFNEGIVEENRFVRNPIPEGGELLKSIPNLPENIANSFKGLPQFNNPAMSNFFANYENIYQSMMANAKGTNEYIEIKRRKPALSRNNNSRKIEVKTKNSTATEAVVSKNPKPKVIPKVNVVTTEKNIVIKEKMSTNIDLIPKAEDLKSIDELSEVIETRHDFENEEIKDESKMNDPVINYEGYIDDYYPQFTDSAAYTANNREVFVKNLGDTKYYYAVDKGNPEFMKRMRFESFGLPERIIKDYDVNKKYDEIEREKIEKPEVKAEEEIIQFRSPPRLEIPDFQTKKVEWSEINPEHYNFDENNDYYPRFSADKASFYSEAKIPYFPGTKDNSKKIQKEKAKDVETVFARSKVVNYGPVYNREDEDSVSAGTNHQVLTNDSYFKNGGTTYVLASSLDHPAMVW